MDERHRAIGPTSCAGELTKLDVAERHLVAVILQQDVAAGRVAEALDVLVFALGDQRLHFRAPDLELHHLLAVQPVLDVVPPDDESRLVPFADRLRRVRRRRDQIVERPGRPVAVHPCLRIRVPLIVQDLHLVADTGVTLAVGCLRDQVLEAAVAARASFHSSASSKLPYSPVVMMSPPESGFSPFATFLIAPSSTAHPCAGNVVE